MDFWHTYFLVVPYIALTIYFLIFQRDDFFLKTRSGIQLLYALMMLGGVFLNLLVWKVGFIDYDFLGYNLREQDNKTKIIPLITIMATIVAVCGWIFTSRVQIINAVKGHSMQVLMNSRTSTVYMQKVDATIKIRRDLILESTKSGDTAAEQKAVLTVEKYENLGNDEKSSVIYMLNFLEFVAIGIRHYNLDEQLLKGSLKSILHSNYRLYSPVIKHLRSIDGDKTFLQIELLHSRWEEKSLIKCSVCKDWDKTRNEELSFKVKYKNVIHFTLAVLTCGTWLLVLFGMWLLTFLTAGSQKSIFTCEDCLNKQKN